MIEHSQLHTILFKTETTAVSNWNFPVSKKKGIATEGR